MNIKGQSHSLNFVQGHLDSKFSNFFSFFLKKITRLVEAIFQVELLWDGRMKARINGLCHMTKMADMPIYAKKSSSLEPKGR